MRLSTRIAAAAFVGLALAPAESLASCQTEWCHQQWRLHLRESEVAARQRLAAAPDDAEAVRRLLDALAQKAERERSIADYEARYRWQPAPDLTHLEAEIAAEERRLSARLVRLEADDPQAWCRHAGQLGDRDERVELLRQRLDEAPDEPQLAVCLSRELVGAERVEAALAVLRGFLAERPEPAVAAELIALLDEDEGEAEVLAVLEDVAARRPDDLEAQRRLLAFLTRKDRFVRYEPRAVKLTEALLATAPVADQRSVCGAIDQRVEGLRRRCLERVYAATLGQEESEELVWSRRGTLESLVGMAFHARDWPWLEGLLARVAAEDLPATWSRIVGFTHGEYCPQFVAAFERGIEWFEEWHAERLVDTLRECGEEERARVLVERAGLLRQDGSDPTSTPGVEWLRGGSCPFGPESLPHRRWFTELAADDASGRLRAAYERWTLEEPRNGCAWLGLATLVERAGDADGALAAWRAATELAPANLDLVVAFGAAALRLERPAAVREAADRLRRHPAAVPRHHAEAAYLLGRLARREGRWEEASDLLASYFLRRIELAGCPPPCDRALLLHLVEAGHRERLARYLAARKALVAARPVREEAAAEHPWRRDSQGEMAGELAELGDVDEEDLPDPEPLFCDDELLALGWSLRDVDSVGVVVTRRW